MRNFVKLENGALLAQDKMDGIETISISFLVKTGSKYEQPEVSGISHFLEHMAFKGTSTRSAQQIVELFDSIGYLNAYTSKEHTVYYAKVLRDEISTAIDVMTDILQDSIFSEEEIAKEREVILQEMAQTEDTPDDVVFELFQNTAYPEQAMGRPILGDPEVIKSVTSQHFVDYVNDRYGFNNIVIAAAGNFQGTEIEDLIQAKFHHMPKSSAAIEVNSNYQGGDIRKERDLEQIQMVLGFEGVSYYDENYYVQQTLSMLAGGGMSSRLFQEVREKRGLAYSISSFASSYQDTGIFGVYSSSSENNMNQLITVVIEELQKMLTDITEEELQRAKAQVRASILMAQESSISRSKKFASNLAIYGRYIEITEIIEKLNMITPQAIMKFLHKTISSSKPTLATIGKVQKLIQYEDVLQKLKV